MAKENRKTITKYCRPASYFIKNKERNFLKSNAEDQNFNLPFKQLLPQSFFVPFLQKMTQYVAFEQHLYYQSLFYTYRSREMQ